VPLRGKVHDATENLGSRIAYVDLCLELDPTSQESPLRPSIPRCHSVAERTMLPSSSDPISRESSDVGSQNRSETAE
jgi:hypothetical protein